MEALTSAVKQAAFTLLYAQKDITADVLPMVVSVRYMDKQMDESDEVEITLDDPLGRWRGSWYPQKGDAVNLTLGLAGEARLPCGDFEVDEPEIQGPPHQVVIRGLATGITKDMRTPRNLPYEQQSLRQMALQVASRHGLQLVGTVSDDMIFARVTQHQKSDLAFLKRMAQRFGYAFSVRGSKLVFHDLAELDRTPSVLDVHFGDLNRYSLKTNATGKYRGVTVQYHNPKTGAVVSHTEYAPGITTGDVLKLDERVENLQQAKARAKAQLHAIHGRLTQGTLDFLGDPHVASGNNITLLEAGSFSGRYRIRTATHTIDQGGTWSVEPEVHNVSQIGLRD